MNSTGEGLSPDDDRGPMMLASGYAFFAVTFIVFVGRIASRLYPKFSMTAADYTIALAMICQAISLGFITSAVLHGFGKHAAFVPLADIGIMVDNLFGVYLSGLTASCFARVSIACLLLQFTRKRSWRVLIWSTIVLQFLTGLMYYVIQLVQCGSVLADKLKMENSQCLIPNHVWGFTYAAVAVAMVSDLICATIPIFLIWRLSRSLIERILVCILMASSLLASCIGIPRLYFMATYDFNSTDGFYLMVPEVFWSRLEESVIIMAACAPLLKSPIERLLRLLGLPTFALPEPELNVVITAGSTDTAHYDSAKDKDSTASLPGSARPESNQSDPEQGATPCTTSAWPRSR